MILSIQQYVKTGKYINIISMIILESDTVIRFFTIFYIVKDLKINTLIFIIRKNVHIFNEEIK